ncbi:hypothetical protein V493_06750 [Pseudogymnoascus sp. VKM F-4281 (FW-2241)]|nr:hypothetical protein V493_06750 [Pseudogymnoascus sp. VKM F-4281 (FW-2241)]
MLLTQSQVSIFFSSVIIFFLTSALFLSGYVLQQKTLTNLRAAIRPSHLSTPSDTHFYNPSQAQSPLPNISPRDSSQLIEVDTTPQTYLTLLTSYLPSSGKPTPPKRRGGGFVSTANKLIHRWIARVRGEKVVIEEEDDESIPMEMLSRAARRRRIKKQIRTEGDGEAVDFNKMYRPRKRVW